MTSKKPKKPSYKQLIFRTKYQDSVIEAYRRQVESLNQNLKNVKAEFDAKYKAHQSRYNLANCLGQAIEANSKAMDALARVVGGPGF